MTQTLRADGLTHSVFEDGRERITLAPLTRSFSPGTLHVLAGSQGEDKKTLLSILALSVAPRHGRIWWGERNMTALAPATQARWRRMHIGLISSSSRLVSVMTVAEHVRLAGATKLASTTAAEQARGLGLSGRLSALPEQLSDEEKQRVAIAQVLSARKSVLLADEPTAPLDDRGSLLVAATLRDFARQANAVVICASDDPALIDAADEVLVLDEGQRAVSSHS